MGVAVSAIRWLLGILRCGSMLPCRPGSTRGRRRVANHEMGCNFHLASYSLVRYLFQQHLHSHFAEGLSRNVDCGHRRTHELGKIRIVKTNDRKILRNSQTSLGQSMIDTESSHVRNRDDTSEMLSLQSFSVGLWSCQSSGSRDIHSCCFHPLRLGLTDC